MATTDPASKLLSYLDAFNKNATDGISLTRAWTAVFSCSSANGIYRHLDRLIDLVEEIESAIHAVPDLPAETYLTGFVKLKTDLRPPHLGQPAANSFFDNGLRTRLEFCSHVLRKETVIDEVTLTDLKKSIDEFAENVRAAELSPILRKALLDLAEQMRQSIAEYEIRGAKALKKAFGQMLAEVAIHYSEIKDAGDTPWKQKLDAVVQRLKSGLQMASNTTTLINFAPKILEFLT